MAEKLKKRRRVSAKSKILGTLVALLGALFICLVSPMFSRQPLSKVDSIMTLPLSNNTSLDVVKHGYNPKTHVYMEQFMINTSQSEDDTIVNTSLDAETEKDIANIKWAGRVIVQKGDTSKIKSSFTITDDRMITIFVKNVPSDYTAIRFDLKLKKRNPLLTSSIIEKKQLKLRFYSTQIKTKPDKQLKVLTDDALQNQYVEYQIDQYEKAMAALKKENRVSRADIKQNNELISEQTAELDNETEANQEETNSQIDDYTQTNETDKTAIKNNNSKIKEIENQIELLKQQKTEVGK